jgi:hypothetical protein
MSGNRRATIATRIRERFRRARSDRRVQSETSVRQSGFLPSFRLGPRDQLRPALGG